MSEKFEFWPEPTYEEAWWSNLATTVKTLAELLEKRPQAKKPEPLKAIEIQGTLTQADLPRATMVANERLFALADVARWLGVSRSYVEKKMNQGLLTTYTPEFYRSAKRNRRFVREEELRRFLGSR